MQMSDGEFLILYKYFPATGPMGKQKIKWFYEGRLLVTPPMYLNDPAEMCFCQEPMTAEECRGMCSSLELDDEKTATINSFIMGQAIKGQVDPAIEAKRRQKLLSGEMGVLSLTENPLSRVMWAHYAEDHKGFVAGFIHKRFDPITIGEVSYETAMGPFGLAIKVNYAESLPAVQSDSKNSIRVFCTKQRDWSHEVEWRVVGYLDADKMSKREKLSGEPLVIGLLPHEDGRTYYSLSFSPSELKCILLGMRSTSMLTDKFRALLSQTAFQETEINKVEYDGLSRRLALRGAI